LTYNSTLASFLLQHHELLLGLLLIGFFLSFLRPLGADSVLTALEQSFGNLARRRTLAIFTVALGSIAIRLCLLPILPIPVPYIQDEFSHLLAADTFAHGHITNPPHPLGLFVDTFNAVEFPTYMSKYPPADALFLAAGQILGHPWIGVLLSIGLMCASALWMLQAWFSPRWAFLGAVLMFLQVGIFTAWVNTYLDGPVAAIGGALVMGALPRIFRRQRISDSILLAVGVGVLANVRPYEGLLLCIPVAIALVVWLLGRCGAKWQQSIRRVVLPIACVLLVVAGAMTYYNWRITGHPLTMPYILYQKDNSSTPLFIWQKLRPPIEYKNPQLAALETTYNEATYRARWVDLAHLKYRRGVFAFFFLPVLWLPFSAEILSILHDRKMHLLAGQFFFCVMGSTVTVWLHSHYVAPLTATTFALIVQGMRRLRWWQWRGRPVGIGFTRMVFVLTLTTVGFNIVDALRGQQSVFAESKFGIERARVENRLEQMPGNQLVIVRYSPHHNLLEEAVCNRADIDHAKVVWAREIPQQNIQLVLDYFHDRSVWMWEPDANPPRLSRYSAAGD
jgi:hypothetical protein